MKKNVYPGAHYIAFCFLLMSCEKNETHYYADPENQNLAIFSNTGNNLMTCFFDDHQWKTTDRKSGTGFGATSATELSIHRSRTSGAFDTLNITWQGNSYNADQYDIAISLPVAKNFEWKDFAAYAGKRISIDSSNGYFSLYQSYYNIHPSFTGTGVIYFNTASIDSTGTDHFNGRIAGLLQANFNDGFFTHNITNGRFDDNITSFEIRNY